MEDFMADDKRINEALELLNEVARDRKSDIQDAVNKKYTDLKSVLESFTSNVQERATDLYEDGRRKVTDAATDIDLTVRRNPWAFIGGAAAFGIIMGYLMGRKRD